MKFLKLLLSLLLIVALFGIGGLYAQTQNFGTISHFFADLSRNYQWPFYLYQGILLVLIVCLVLALLAVLFKPLHKKNLQIKRETGQINVPVHALESIAQAATNKVYPQADTQVKVKITKHQKAQIEVTVLPEKPVQFISKGKQIQANIEQMVPQMTGMPVEEVKVVFKKRKLAKNNLLPTHKKEPRVV